MINGGANEQGFNGQEFMKSLQAIQKIPICQGYLKGGGATNCKIRACAQSRKLADCTECKEFMKCENREALGHVHTGALKVGMIVRTEKVKSPLSSTFEIKLKEFVISIKFLKNIEAIPYG